MTWAERIARAWEPRWMGLGHKGFTARDDIDADSRNSCAVTEAAGEDIAWSDWLLTKLGDEFCRQVQSNDVPGARETHERIRQRVKELRA
jgi:hypothetical protein